MSSTKNLCTVPASTVSDTTNFIVEDGLELKRIPKIDVIKTKLTDMTVVDVYNLLNGSEANAEVNAQTFMNTLADMVADKLLKKSQLINNFLTTEAGVGALDALAGATLKKQLDQVNGDLGMGIIPRNIIMLEKYVPFSCHNQVIRLNQFLPGR